MIAPHGHRTRTSLAGLKKRYLYCPWQIISLRVTTKIAFIRIIGHEHYLMYVCAWFLVQIIIIIIIKLCRVGNPFSGTRNQSSKRSTLHIYLILMNTTKRLVEIAINTPREKQVCTLK